MKILSFGEIIWDCFPDKRCLGGAPLNFAAHAAKLGAESWLYSAVENSDEETLRAVRETGVKTDLIHRVPFPTGYTDVTLDASGSATYKIVLDVAWDNIPTSDIPNKRWDALYFGTLAQRSEVSARTLDAVYEQVEAGEVFCDLNLRHKFWSPDGIDRCLRRATLAKVNREEYDALPEQPFARYPQLKALLVTLDADGAKLLLRDGGVLFSEKPACEVVSTVGAGDSFAAAFLVSWLNGKSPADCLAAGQALANRVVGQLGAI